MSDTPETDKAEDRDPMMYDDWAWIVPANFARRLERERDEARRELAAAEELHRRQFATLKGKFDFVWARLTESERKRDEALKGWTTAINGWCKDNNGLKEASREREDALNALRWIAGRFCHEKTTFQLAQEAYEMSSKARWTLQKIEQKEEAK